MSSCCFQGEQLKRAAGGQRGIDRCQLAVLIGDTSRQNQRTVRSSRYLVHTAEWKQPYQDIIPILRVSLSIDQSQVKVFQLREASLFFFFILWNEILLQFVGVKPLLPVVFLYVTPLFLTLTFFDRKIPAINLNLTLLNTT